MKTTCLEIPSKAPKGFLKPQKKQGLKDDNNRTGIELIQ